jgi:hypothetical protein
LPRDSNASSSISAVLIVVLKHRRAVAAVRGPQVLQTRSRIASSSPSSAAIASGRSRILHARKSGQRMTRTKSLSSVL